MDSWQEACQSESGGIVSVPDGTFQLDPIEFEGPCKNQVTFQLDGTLQAPTGIINGDDWIKFHNIDGLIIQGSGTLDGQGASAWQDKCPSCPPLTTVISFLSLIISIFCEFYYYFIIMTLIFVSKYILIS